MSWDAGIQAGGERSLPRFAKSLGNGRRTPRKPPRRLGMGASARSVGRIPDQRIDIVIVVLGGAAEIDVDAARPEFRRGDGERDIILARTRSEEHTAELQAQMRNSYAVFCMKKKIK